MVSKKLLTKAPVFDKALTEKEWELIGLVRSIKVGKLEGIWIKDNQPDYVDVVRDHVKLGNGEVH